MNAARMAPFPCSLTPHGLNNQKESIMNRQLRCILWALTLILSATISSEAAGPEGPHAAHRHMNRGAATNPALCSQGKCNDAICFRPVGFFHASCNGRGSTPRQGVLSPETRATITIEPPYRKALLGLERFQYIIVLYYFDRIGNWRETVKPPWARESYGLFATRTPRRPNPIGMTVVKLEGIDGKRGILHVSGVDAFDSTPVLDIKPYLPAIDCINTTIEAEHIPEELRKVP